MITGSEDADDDTLAVQLVAGGLAGGAAAGEELGWRTGWTWTSLVVFDT
jgi:hypothetical protein